MAKVLTLKFTDGSSKECEVTGRDMGGESTYYMPLQKMQCGRIKWDTEGYIYMNHFVNIHEVGADYVVASVVDSRGHEKMAPTKLYEGIKKGSDYYFGEWNYYFSVEVVLYEEE